MSELSSEPSKTRPIKEITVHVDGGALARLGESVERYAAASRADATTKAYARQCSAFAAWCRAHGVSSLPAIPEVLAAYLSERADAGIAVAGLAQALSAIADLHQRAGVVSPCRDARVRAVWAGIRRTHGRPPRQARPLAPKELRAMIRALRPGIAAVRNRLLMLLGFGGAMRRDELVNVHREHVTLTADGRLKIVIPKSKGDQESRGQKVIVSRGSDRVTCPVEALADWLLVSRITTGPIFLSVQRGKLTTKSLLPGDVSRILKSAAKRAGVPTTFTSGHSLRRGLATTARREGRSLDSIQRQARHKNLNTTVGYVDAVELELAENASEGIGL